ncbi:MAG: B12-binding domain-containing radical SAM protein, partial [Candidatus Brocadiales bacterium]
VLLLEPPRPPDPSRFQEVVNAPLSACLFSPYLVSLLRSKGIGVELLDANLLGLSMEETLKELTSRLTGVAPMGRHTRTMWSSECGVRNLIPHSTIPTPHSELGLPLLGVHLVYLWEKTEEVFGPLSKIKSHNPRIHVNLYGYYPTFNYREILQRFPFVDSVTLGEPEYPFLRLAQQVGAIHELPLQHIKGLAFRGGEEIVANHRDADDEPDSLPFPDRSLLPLYQEKGLATYILGSRGCYGRCTFCYVGPFYGKWRGRSPQNILEELKGLYEKGVSYFYFADANFFGPGRAGRERASNLAEIILKEKLNIRFGMECRANDLEKDSLSRLVAAGLREVFLGVESACDHTLKRFRKDTSQEVNRRAIELLRRFGIEPNLGFIMFEPHTRLEDIRTNFEFLKDTKLLRSPAITAHLLSHKQTLLMGTADYGVHGVQRPHRKCGVQNFNSALRNPNSALEGTPHSQSMDSIKIGCSFAGYESHYDFEDPTVQSFYEAVSQLCHGVLSTLKPEEAQSCCDAQTEKEYLLNINKVLVDTYEKVLCIYENGDGYKKASNLINEVVGARCNMPLHH